MKVRCFRHVLSSLCGVRWPPCPELHDLVAAPPSLPGPQWSSLCPSQKLVSPHPARMNRTEFITNKPELLLLSWELPDRPFCLLSMMRDTWQGAGHVTKSSCSGGWGFLSCLSAQPCSQTQHFHWLLGVYHARLLHGLLSCLLVSKKHCTRQVHRPGRL